MIAPGQAVTVRGTVEHAQPGQAVCLAVPSGFIWVGPEDVTPRRRVRFGACRTTEGAVLCESGPWLVIAPDGHPMPIVQHREWCEGIPAIPADEQKD